MSRIDTRPTPNGLEHGATLESNYARCSTEALQNDTSDTATHQLPRLMEAVSAGTYSLLALGEDNLQFLGQDVCVQFSSTGRGGARGR